MSIKGNRDKVYTGWVWKQKGPVYKIHYVVDNLETGVERTSNLAWDLIPAFAPGDPYPPTQEEWDTANATNEEESA